MSARGEIILGVGVDLVEISRLRQTLKRWGSAFCAKVFLDAEREYCDMQACPHRHYAGRFAVKEAVAKAFGTGIGDPVGWRDIEVVRNPDTGAPSVHLHGKALDTARRRRIARILISLSHSHNHAVAQAVVIGTPGKAPRVATKKQA